MQDGWNARLKAAISEDGRSLRALSLAAGLGPNYLEQTFSRGTSPVHGKLSALLEVLGQEAALYVYTGVKANAETIAALNLLAQIPEELRGNALGLLRNLAVAGQPVPEADSMPDDAD